MKNTKNRTTHATVRVLGVDPGTATTGWAVIEEKSGCLCPVAYGHIQTPKKDSESMRLLEITNDLEKIIKKYRPKEAAIEKIFFFKNQKTVIPISQSRGAIILTLEQKSVKVFGYTPLQVKQAITGYGRADKKQVQLMAKNILSLKAIPKPDDAADAIAIAICHLNSRKLNNNLTCN
jgi:crossover junction endodeoxyribonuclease RuvC